jgi:hypothetical protein
VLQIVDPHLGQRKKNGKKNGTSIIFKEEWDIHNFLRRRMGRRGEEWDIH